MRHYRQIITCILLCSHCLCGHSLSIHRHKSATKQGTSFWPYTPSNWIFKPELIDGRWCNDPAFMYAAAFGGGGCYSTLSQLGTLKWMTYDDSVGANNIEDFPLQVAGCVSGGCWALAVLMANNVVQQHDEYLHYFEAQQAKSYRPQQCAEQGHNACQMGEYCLERMLVAACYPEDLWIDTMFHTGCALFTQNTGEGDLNSWVESWLRRDERFGYESPSLKCLTETGCKKLTEAELTQAFGVNKFCIQRSPRDAIEKEVAASSSLGKKLASETTWMIQQLSSVRSIVEFNQAFYKMVGLMQKRETIEEEHYKIGIWYKYFRSYLKLKHMEVNYPTFVRKWEETLKTPVRVWDEDVKEALLNDESFMDLQVGDVAPQCVGMAPEAMKECVLQANPDYPPYSFLPPGTDLCKWDFKASIAESKRVGPIRDLSYVTQWVAADPGEGTFMNALAKTGAFAGGMQNVIIVQYSMYQNCIFYTHILHQQANTGEYPYPFGKVDYKFVGSLLKRLTGFSILQLQNVSENHSSSDFPRAGLMHFLLFQAMSGKEQRQVLSGTGKSDSEFDPLFVHKHLYDGAFLEPNAVGETLMLLGRRKEPARPRTLVIHALGDLGASQETSGVVLRYFRAKVRYEELWMKMDGALKYLFPIFNPLFSICPIRKMYSMNPNYFFKGDWDEGHDIFMLSRSVKENNLMWMFERVGTCQAEAYVMDNAFWGINGDFPIFVVASILRQSDNSKKWVAKMYKYAPRLRKKFRNFPISGSNFAESFQDLSSTSAEAAFSVLSYSSYKGYMLQCSVETYMRKKMMPYMVTKLDPAIMKTFWEGRRDAAITGDTGIGSDGAPTKIPNDIEGNYRDMITGEVSPGFWPVKNYAAFSGTCVTCLLHWENCEDFMEVFGIVEGDRTPNEAHPVYTPDEAVKLHFDDWAGLFAHGLSESKNTWQGVCSGIAKDPEYVGEEVAHELPTPAIFEHHDGLDLPIDGPIDLR